MAPTWWLPPEFQTYFNRTLEELKQFIIIVEGGALSHFNRTLEELKPSTSKTSTTAAADFNRTLEELKQSML